MDQVRPRGLTLAEVLVAGAVFAGLALALLFVYQTGLRARTKADVQTETYRAAMQGIESIRQRLRGARLLEPSVVAGPAASQASIQAPVLVDGVLKVGPGGVPTWATPETLEVDARGNLVVSGSNGSGVLSRLGTGGRVSFVRTHERALEVIVLAVHDHADQVRSSRYQARLLLTLPNQP